MIHPSVRIHPTARVDCERVSIGAGGVIGAGCVIEGRSVEIGREFWMDEGAHIGGGSCRDPQAFLKAGDWLHMGRNSHVNTARGVVIGDECGIGRGTAIYTHGAYLDELAGFPVQFAPVVIGSRVWLPDATVMPGVVIGDDIVVAARSLVNRSIKGGSLVGGVPAKAIREKAYPRVLSDEEKWVTLDRVVEECRTMIADGRGVIRDGFAVAVFAGGSATRFDTATRSVVGPVRDATEIVRHQLRRHGIRFRCSPVGGTYEAWT